jgi:hypothetical protein
MAKPETPCSFCNQPNSKVEKLVEGIENDVCICNRCVARFYWVLRKAGVDMTTWRRAILEDENKAATDGPPSVS